MGRRNRNRAKTVPVDHVARVRVPDAVWTEFRRTLGARSVARGLGELVEQEVARQRANHVRRDTATDRELLDALNDARELQDQLSIVVARIEARSARRERTEDSKW